MFNRSLKSNNKVVAMINMSVKSVKNVRNIIGIPVKRFEYVSRRAVYLVRLKLG